MSFSVLKRQYFWFLLFLRHSLDAWLLTFTSGHHSITQPRSLTPVRCEYTTANLLEYIIWSLCQLVFLCEFYIVHRMLSSTKLSGNKLTVSFFWRRAEKWVYIIPVLRPVRLWTFWFWTDLDFLSRATDLATGTHSYLTAGLIYIYFCLTITCNIPNSSFQLKPKFSRKKIYM